MSDVHSNRDTHNNIEDLNEYRKRSLNLLQSRVIIDTT
jgi:hypothetical protein